MSEPSYNTHVIGMDWRQWREMLASMPANELYRLQGELQAMVRHPSLAFDAPRKFMIGEKLAEIVDESEKRWLSIWEHPSNDALSFNLYRVWRAA